MTCKVNDTILYGAEGVCRIVGISNQAVNGTNREYYVLKPVYDDKSTIFAPMHNEKIRAKMRRILSAGEIHALIETMPPEDTIWIENDAARKEQYKKILAGGDRAQLIRLIKTLYLRQQTQKDKGKKMYILDEGFMKDAEKMLYDEFAHVLNIKREQVLPFILGQIQAEEKKEITPAIATE